MILGVSSLLFLSLAVLCRLLTGFFASKKFGGLGVSSLFVLNRALIFKWVWHFLSHDNSLWSRVISAVHGSNSHPISVAYNSPWGTIIKEVKALNDKDSGGPEAQQLEQLTNLLDSVSLSNMEDRCFWDLNGEGVFQVKDVRSVLDETFLPKENIPTRWVKSIPIKVAKEVLKLICRWWDLVLYDFDNYDGWLLWFKSIRLGSKLK
ncbi:hypothetical protein Tco_1052225, partial [Tanacetum coccineum]